MVESVLSNDGVVTVAMMATQTSRLLIGTNIANVYLRHPVMLGAAAVAIDEIAPERLVLGLGPNNRDDDHAGGIHLARSSRGAPGDHGHLARGVRRAGRGRPAASAAGAPSHPDPLGGHGARDVRGGGHPRGRTHALHQFAGPLPPRRRALSAGGQRGRARSDRLPVSLLVPTFIDDDLPTARRAAREFLVQYVRWPHYAKTFAASGYADEMEQVATAYRPATRPRRWPPSAMSCSTTSSCSALPRGSARASTVLARAGVEWITLGPQAVATHSLAQQAERMIAVLAPP